MNEELLKTISRINATQDGQDFFKFLETMSKNNYKAYKCAPAEFNDIHKGQAIAIDGLIELFETCDDKLRMMEEQNAKDKAIVEAGGEAGWA